MPAVRSVYWVVSRLAWAAVVHRYLVTFQKSFVSEVSEAVDLLLLT